VTWVSYVAPEQIGDFQGQDDPPTDSQSFTAHKTKASDVYAFGMLALEVSADVFVA
jgi:serine/threonine protein kinase